MTIERYILRTTAGLPVLLLILAMVIHCGSTSAQARLTVEAPDTLAFRMKLDGQPINQALVSSLTLPSVASGKREIKLEFANETTFNQIIPLKDRIHYTFGFRPVKGAFRLQILSEVAYQPSSPTGLASAISETENEEETVIIESIPEAGGCTDPISEWEFGSLKKEISTTTFDAKRFEKMRGFVVLSCVRVEQLRYMLAQLETEDHKLKLLQSAMGHVYDPSRLPSVLEEFFLEKNKEKAAMILSGK